MKIKQNILDELKKDFSNFMVTSQKMTPQEERLIRALQRIPEFKEEYEKEINIRLKRVQSLIDALQEEGFQSATYRLPFFCFTNFGVEEDYPYLLLTGIKRNAQEKKDDDPLVDTVERELLKYEKLLAGFIDEDYKIKLEDAKEFLKIFSLYLEYYYSQIDFELDENFDYDIVLSSCIAKMALYIYFRSKDTEYDEKTAQKFLKMYYFYFTLGLNHLETAYRILENFRSYDRALALFDEAIIKALEKTPEEFKVDKRVLNEHRGLLNKKVRTLLKEIDKIKKLKADLLNGRVKNIGQSGEFGFLRDTKIDDYASISKKMMILEHVQEKLEIEAMDIKTLATYLSSDGIKEATLYVYLLVINDNTCEYTDRMDIIYLLLSGIKKNIEASELHYRNKTLPVAEKQVFKYVEEDLSVRHENITGFVNTFMALIASFKEKTCNTKDDNDLFDDILFNIHVKLILYVIYCNLGIYISGEAVDYIKGQVKYYNQQSDDITKGGIAKLIYDSTYERMEMLKKNYVPSEKPKTETIDTEREYELFEYIEDGVVIKPCDEEKFVRLLDEAQIGADRRHEYLAQLRNLKNKLAKEELARRIEFCKEAVFEEDERSLYQKYKERQDAKNIISSIDDIILMFMDASSDEQIILLDKLHDLFDQLRTKDSILSEDEIVLYEKYKNDESTDALIKCIDEITNEIIYASAEDKGELLRQLEAIFASLRTKEELLNENQSRVFYYTEVDKPGDDETQEPVLLKSISKDKKCNKKQLLNLLSKLIAGNKMGDRRIECGEDVQLWYKGRETKIYYAVKDDNIVIIDGGSREEVLKRVLKIVKTEDFKNFIERFGDTIASSDIQKSGRHTTLIVDALTKGGKTPTKKL